MSFRVVVFVAFRLLLSSVVFSQNKAKDFFIERANVVWYGFDYTHAKYIGSLMKSAQEGMMSPSEFKYFVIPSLNGLVFKEPSKYNLERTFYKDFIKIDTSFVNKANNTTDVDNFQTYENLNYKLDTSKFQSYLEKYRFPQSTDNSFGIIVFVESINKINSEASYYFTVFDINSKKELFTERIVGYMHGDGVKNHSARSIYEAFEQIKKEDYKKWRNKYIKL